MTTKPKAKKFRIRLPGDPASPVAPASDGFGERPFPTAAPAAQASTATAPAPTPAAQAANRAEVAAARQARAAERTAKGKVLELVSPDEAMPAIERAAPAQPKRPSAPPPPQAEDRAREILQIQRDIARRRRRRAVMLGARLLAFVAAPTLLAAWYFFSIATPMYATHSEFVIQQADQSAGGGMGGLLSRTGLATSQDSITVQSYLGSRESMLRLDADIGYKAHFSQDWIDPLQRLPAGASNEEAYRHYTDHVKIGFDPTEGIIRMEVIAADPEVSAAFSRALIDYAEEQVDTLSLRLREDQMRGAMESFREAEARMEEAQARVLGLQEQLGVLDPASESAALMAQISTFETQLAEKRLERAQLLANPAPNSARLAGVEGDIDRLQALVAELRAELTDGSGGTGSLARISAELQMAQVDLETRTMMMQEALQQLESARIEANRQVRYLSTGVNPIPTDEASYPRALENTILTFFVFAGVYLMISLTVSILREQVSG